MQNMKFFSDIRIIELIFTIFIVNNLEDFNGNMFLIIKFQINK